jgi:hypothetical protein
MTNDRTGEKTKMYVIAVVAAMFAGTLACTLFVSRLTAGHSIIDKLQSDKLASSDISRIEILQYPMSGWSFSERDYDKFERVRITDSSAADELISLLRKDSIPGIQHHNHPELVRSGLLRMDVSGGEHYYVFYQVSFAIKLVNTRRSTPILRITQIQTPRSPLRILRLSPFYVITTRGFQINNHPLTRSSHHAPPHRAH